MSNFKEHLQGVESGELVAAFQGIDAKGYSLETSELDEEFRTRQAEYPGIFAFPNVIASTFLRSGYTEEVALIIHMAASLTLETLVEVAEIEELPPID